MIPYLGQIVSYRSRTGSYSLAAIVTATTETLNPDGVAGGHLPALSSPTHVHLAVLTPGLPPVITPGETRKIIDPDQPLGHRDLSPHEELTGNRFAAMTPFGGTYAEFDIPFAPTCDERPGESHQAPGTWAQANPDRR